MKYSAATLNRIFSDDVIALNPELSQAATYRVKPERVLKFNDEFDSELERCFFLRKSSDDWNIIRCSKYGGIQFNLPGNVGYTPDFIGWKDDVLYPFFFECKGNMHQKNARDSWTRFRIAAGLYPCFTWVWVTKSKRGEWIEKVYRP